MDGTTRKLDKSRQVSRQMLGQMPPANPLPVRSCANRASQAELEQRVLYTTKMILDGRRKGEIKVFFRKQYGVKARQAERYLRFARERLAEASNVDLEQMRAEQWARFMEIYRKTENDATKIAALRAAGSLYGLDAPQKVARTTVDGKDRVIARKAVSQLTIQQLRALRDAKMAMERIATGELDDA